MVSKFTLLSILLLATATLVVPSPLVEASSARGHEDRRSQPTGINHVASRPDAIHRANYIKRFAGGETKERKNFFRVQGSFVVPSVRHVPGVNKSAADIVVTIGGSTDHNVRRSGIRAGVSIRVKPGDIRFYPFFIIFPRPCDTAFRTFPEDFPIHPGDHIAVGITPSHSFCLFTVWFHNLSTRQKYMATPPGPYSFSSKTAAWGVVAANPAVTIPSFSNVTFDSLSYAQDDSDNRHYMNNTKLYNIVQSAGRHLTSVSLTGDGLGLNISRQLLAPTGNLNG